jgi:hypothetical protein
MKLEQRVLKDYYPRQMCNSKSLYLAKTHGVKSFGFRNTGKDYEYTIESPSVEIYAQRKYMLNWNRNGNYDDAKTDAYRGVIGESIMRIIVNEFFRRLNSKHYLKGKGFIKSDLNPLEDKKIILENEDYVLEGISRYNQIVRLKNSSKKSVAEYDGLFEYTSGRINGLVICESKTGCLGYLNNAEINEEKIINKIIKPVNSLFKDKQVDFLLMGTPDEIFQKKRNKPIKSGLVTLNEMLNKHNIGLIPMILPETRSKIEQIATSMNDMNNLDELREEHIPKDTRYVEMNGIIRLIKGKRVELIAKRSNNNTLTILYESGKKK